MILEEKVAQMCQYVGVKHMRSSEKNMTIEEMQKSHARGFYPGLHSSEVEKMVEEGLIGSFLHVLDHEEANYLQSLAQKSRLRIPLLIGIDAIHGNGLCRGVTIYPTPIGQASSFNTELVEEASRQTAYEVRATGAHWAFTPNVDIARDPRWGRVGETFGEDPLLVSRMGVATVRGLQGDLWNHTRDTFVLACVKHLVGGGQPVNGLNIAPLDVSERTLREIFFSPFQACIEAGAFTLMMAHNETNGIPAHADEWLMEEVVRKEWGFKGFIVSDWMDMERLHTEHLTAATIDEAFITSVNAGMDMHMHGPHFFESIAEGVRSGRISERRVDQATRKILEAKFRLGLFEDPYVEPAISDSLLFNPLHRETALELARQSVVLLKNDGILPLQASRYKNILVTGPNAHSNAILGDWAASQPEGHVITILEGLRKVAPENNFVFHDVGWNIRKMDESRVKAATAAARKCDLAIVVVGEYSLREHWMDKTCGENTDRSDIDLPGLQQELVEAVYASGIPTVVVLVNGRPLGVEWIAAHIPALLEVWEPDSFGGEAVAEILFGQVNPGGKLPLTIPRHVGQLQMTYNRKNTLSSFSYAFGESTPLYEFGYGLSYTEFTYGVPELSRQEIRMGESVTVKVTITNSGDRAGDEVVQCYLRDDYSSVTRPVKELKDFRRISLQPGESREVLFTITPDMMAFYDRSMKRVIEPGSFTVVVGSSSRNEDLQGVTYIVKK